MQHAGLSDNGHLIDRSGRQHANMARRDARSRWHQHRPLHRHGALAFDICTRRNRLDQDDPGGLVRLGVVERYNRIRFRRQRLTRCHHARWKAQRVIRAGADALLCPDGKPIAGRTIARRKL
jgi:hypothetical protein